MGPLAPCPASSPSAPPPASSSPQPPRFPTGSKIPSLSVCCVFLSPGRDPCRFATYVPRRGPGVERALSSVGEGARGCEGVTMTARPSEAPPPFLPQCGVCRRTRRGGHHGSPGRERDVYPRPHGRGMWVRLEPRAKGSGIGYQPWLPSELAMTQRWGQAFLRWEGPGMPGEIRWNPLSVTRRGGRPRTPGAHGSGGWGDR